MPNKKTEFHTEWFDIESEEFDIPHLQGKRMYRLNAPDSVVILARTPEKKIVMVRQFRPASGQYTLEFPAGAIDAGESPEEAIARELYEETGYRCAKIQFLCNGQVAADRIKSNIFIFLGSDAVRDTAHTMEDGVEILAYSPEELKQQVLASTHVHFPTLGILHLAEWREK